LELSKSEAATAECLPRADFGVRLGCVLHLYPEAWEKKAPGDWHGLRLTASSPGSSPVVKIVIRDKPPVHNARARQLTESDLERYRDWWVIRSTPHVDDNIHVCAGAVVWLEIAKRPRMRMPKIVHEDAAGKPPTEIHVPRRTIRNSEFAVPLISPGTPGEADPIALTVVGDIDPSRPYTITDQWPEPEQWLEPWQRIVLMTRQSAARVPLATMALTRSKSSIQNDNQDSGEIIVTVDPRSDDLPVTFTASSGELSEPTVVTENGVARTQLKSGLDRTPRTISVTATSRLSKQSIGVDVVAKDTGTTLPCPQCTTGEIPAVGTGLAVGAGGTLLLGRLRKRRSAQPVLAPAESAKTGAGNTTVSVRLRMDTNKS